MRALNDKNCGTIAYILKNFPKISETFIASEIYRLEKLGVNLKLFVIKPPCEVLKHAVVEKIKAERFYLPATTSLSETSLFSWLKLHFGDFSASAIAIFKSRPLKTLKAVKFAFAQAVRARNGFLAFPRKLYLKEFFQAAAIAEQILTDKEIKHLHAHFAHGATTVAWMVSIITGLKFSFTAHAKDIYLESLNPADFLTRKLNAAEFVVTCTRANKQHLEWMSKTPIHCLYHGLNAEFTELLENTGNLKTVQNGHLRALAVGRLVPKKGLDVFIKACAILEYRNVKFTAKIVGENGDHTETLKELIKKFDLDHKVKLAGSMTQNSLFHEYHNSDVFCLPCRVLENGDRDGIPNVMVEAMSCGLPVVSTAISGIPEIINSGENGVLVEPENPSALADSMEKIFADRAFANRLSRAGLKTVQENFNGNASAGKLAQLFEMVSSNGSAAALSLLFETAKLKKISNRRAPRDVFCVIENAYRSAEIADQAVNGIFTNAGLTFDLGRKINWLKNPLPTDEEWQIEWFKFYFGLDMSHAFNRTGDHRYLQIWEYLTWSFIKQVPIGFDTPDVAARRVQNWIYAWRQFAKSPVVMGLGGDLETALVRSIKRQIAFIKENLTAERNHRTLELYAIFIAAIALPEIDENGKLLLFAIENLHENLLTDVQTDGVQREQSSDYHLIVLRSFLGVKKNAQIFNLQLPEGFDERLVKACEFAMHIHRPDGEIPALSDGDTGSFLDLLKLAGELFSRQDFCYVATRGKEGRPPNNRNVSFTESGYFIQRSGWGEAETNFELERFLVFDCGHIGDGGHGHYDLLNVEIAAGGKPLVADIGRYTYSEEGSINWRHFFKGTRAHNTVCVDENDQTEYQRGKPKNNLAEGKFIERIALTDLDILSGKAISPLYDAVHTRRIFFVKNEYWLIWDELKSETPHSFDLRFHLTPDSWNHCLLAQTDRNKIIQTRDVALVFESSKNPIVEPSWYSPEYGIKHRIPCVSVVENNVASTDFFTIVKPINAFEHAPSFEVLIENGNTKIEVCNQQEKIKDRLTWHIAADKLTSVNLERSEVQK